MKVKHLIKTLGGSALLASALAFSTLASAVPVTQLVHFDDANNGWKWYSDADRNFLFDPTNLQSSVLCADSTNGGNGSCVIEGTQTVLPRMTHPEIGTTLQGSASRAPDASGANLEFDLDSFYFLLTGRGEFGGNYIDVTGTFADGSTAYAEFELGSSYTNITNYETGLAAGDLDWNTGYIASFDTLFDGVTSIEWDALSSAQIRLDCVVATFDGTTSEPASDYDIGCGGSSVPEPSILALLSIGFLGIGAAWRLKKR